MITASDAGADRRRNRPWRTWLGSVVVVPMAFLALLMAIDRTPGIDDAYRIAHAWRFPDSARPPAVAAVGELVALPDSLRTPGNGLKRGWYRLQVTPAQTAARALALYAPAPNGNFALYVNGAAVADGGRFEPAPAFHEFPLLLPIPEALVASAADRLDIHVIREGKYSHLPVLFLGPLDRLQASADYTWWVRAGVVRVTLLVALGLALLALGFFVLRPHDRAYGWFALTLLLWIVHIAHDLVINLPVPRLLWLASNNITLGAFVFGAVVFTHRFVAIQARRVETTMKALLALAATAFVVCALQFGWGVHAVLTRIWVPLVLLAGLYLLARLAQAAWRRPSTEHFALLAAATATLVVGVRDYLYDVAALQGRTVFYLGYGLMLVVAVFGAIVVRRFVTAVLESETLGRELEHRVARKSREIEDNYVRLRELEAEDAQRRERERLLREVHDGVGSQLLRGLALTEHGGSVTALRGVLEECLSDLRLVVDAVDIGDGEGDVLNLLARFRHRVNRRLQGLGVELLWQVADMPPHAIGAAAALDLLRVLQEIFSGLLEQPDVRKIAVVTGTDTAGSGWIEVRGDCGHTMPTSRLAQLQHRAARIGAHIGIDAHGSGIAFRLELPRTRLGT